MTKAWKDLTRPEKGDLIRPYIEIEQLSYSKIAAIVGVTRVAIAGAADRNGIISPYSRGAQPGMRGSAAGAANIARAKGGIAATKRLKPGKIPTKPRPNKFVAAYIPEAAIDRRPTRAGAWDALDGTAPRPLDQHETGTCRWPIGGEAPFTFCCQPTDGKSSWCAAHYALAFKPKVPVKFSGRKSA